MTTETTEAPTTDDTPNGDTPDDGEAGTTDLTAELEKWKGLARKHEKRAKEGATAVTELEELRAASMTETEKAVEAARSEARKQALAEVAGERVAAAITVAASRAIPADQLSTVLSALDRAAFLDDSGEVDSEKVATFVEGITPKNTAASVDLGQGARNTQALGSDPLLNDVSRMLGI